MFHFGLTAMVLFGLSQPNGAWAFFEPRREKVIQILPLVLISNLVQATLSMSSLLFSSVFSSVAFHHFVQIFLTPFLALILFYIYKKILHHTAAYALIPIWLGVAALSYHEAVHQDGSDKKRTSFLGVFFAISGELARSIYIVWIKVFMIGYRSTARSCYSIPCPVVLYCCYVSCRLRIHFLCGPKSAWDGGQWLLR